MRIGGCGGEKKEYGHEGAHDSCVSEWKEEGARAGMYCRLFRTMDMAVASLLLLL